MNWFQIQFNLDDLVFQESDLAELFDNDTSQVSISVNQIIEHKRHKEQTTLPVEAFFAAWKA